jgi:pimeloyl-ACP methyl ester carboxylesterase
MERFTDVGRGITLCHESFGDPADPPILLVMGLGMQMLGWDESFCAQLADRGLFVVRFDNRDAGRSTHVRGRPPTLAQLVHHRFGPQQYRLSDMATDAAELLRRLELAPAHVAGVSMGGMIAQTLAAEHPAAVRSLTSIMSTTGSRLKGQPALAAYRHLLKRAPREREAYVEHMVTVFTAIGSPGFERDEAALRERAARAYDRNPDPRGTGRQLAAILASGNRTAQLRAITAPTLVIHGDQDPLVSPSGGRATAAAIPGARLETIEGMGHDLPQAVWPQVVDAIAAHAGAADRAAGATRRAAA